MAEWMGIFLSILDKEACGGRWGVGAMYVSKT